MSPAPSTVPLQGSLTDLEPALASVTFVVVDLETTGTRPGESEITEIGAVRVRGGVVEAELSTFVSVEGPIPAQIRELTGITPDHLVGAPILAEVVPTFAEFARGAVLVAHNARFDTSFLRAAFRRTGYEWPGYRVVCTLALSRRILVDETRGHRLGELAAHLGATTEPCHRALADARATVDVLHALISRVGDCGVETVSDLLAYDSRLTPEVRRRSGLTDALPSGPGVYLFRDRTGGALYVGSSVNIRRRARGYFTGGEPRGRMRTMIGLVASVEAVPCAHTLEAWSVEERLIDTLRPPYNRRSRSPRRGWWLSPPAEARPPRVVRAPTEGGLGPFQRKGEASAVRDLLCGETSPGAGPGPIAPTEREWESLISGAGAELVDRLIAHVADLTSERAFEHARRARDATADLVTVAATQHGLAATAAVAELVLAQRAAGGTWAVAVVRHGRLAGSGTIPRGASPMPVVDAVRRAASTVVPGDGPLAGATPDEVRAVHRWIDSAPTRIVATTGEWVLPRTGAGAHLGWARHAQLAAEPPPEHTPIRGRGPTAVSATRY